MHTEPTAKTRMPTADHNTRETHAVAHNFLRRILQQQAEETKRRAAQKSLSRLKAEVAGLPPCHPFADALCARRSAFPVFPVFPAFPSFIAELKKASPSQGLLRPEYDPAAIARGYTEAGAACLSVLTNAAFLGESAHLQLVRSVTNLPLLRKDFIIDEYQVYETRLLGADAMLLIVACLSVEKLARLHDLGLELGLDVLVEVHDEEELEIALKVGARMVGVNNRNLKTFEVNLHKGAELLAILAQKKPSVLSIAESGMRTAEQILPMIAAGAGAFLVGTSFMRSADPGQALSALIKSVREAIAKHSKGGGSTVPTAPIVPDRLGTE